MPEFIDLSGFVEENQPVYGGNTSTHFWTESTHEQVGHAQQRETQDETETIRRHLRAADSEEEHVQIRAVVLNEHGPTHIDALSHIDPTYDETIDKMSLDWFYGDAVGVDVSHVSFDDYVTVEDIKTELDENDLAIEDGDAITLHTGHRQSHYGIDSQKQYEYTHNYTGLDKEAAVWLGEQGVKNIGIDSPSIDHSDALETNDYPAHDMCADYEVVNMENMANLDSVAGIRYTLCAFPLKLRDGTGSPIRPVAIIE